MGDGRISSATLQQESPLHDWSVTQQPFPRQKGSMRCSFITIRCVLGVSCCICSCQDKSMRIGNDDEEIEIYQPYGDDVWNHCDSIRRNHWSDIACVRCGRRLYCAHSILHSRNPGHSLHDWSYPDSTRNSISRGIAVLTDEGSTNGY